MDAFDMRRPAYTPERNTLPLFQLRLVRDADHQRGATCSRSVSTGPVGLSSAWWRSGSLITLLCGVCGEGRQIEQEVMPVTDIIERKNSRDATQVADRLESFDHTSGGEGTDVEIGRFNEHSPGSRDASISSSRAVASEDR